MDRVDVPPGENGRRTVSVPSHLAGARLDAVLAELLGVSRARAVALIDGGAVTTSGGLVKKSEKMTAGDSLTVVDMAGPTDEEEAPTLVALPILYQDPDIVVVDKPPGIAVHPAPGWEGPTVVGQLHAQGVMLSALGPSERHGVVHRLDGGTSGVMVLAVSDRAYRFLKDAFHDRKVRKIYHALVQGYPDPSSGTIDAPIGRHPSSSWKFAVTRDGRPAITHYDTLEVFPGATLVEVTLETGRTHQIRVHFQAEHHPLVGDGLYGADPTFTARLGLTRQWLHAVELGFTHPGTGRDVQFRSEYPEDLHHALRVLERA